VHSTEFEQRVRVAAQATDLNVVATHDGDGALPQQIGDGFPLSSSSSALKK
jgi:hypothetical protein